MENGRRPSIRPRPKIKQMVDYQMCVSTQRDDHVCMYGLKCAFAHSEEELLEWNRERWSQEPRPRPNISDVPAEFVLCKNVLDTGSCSYGQRCTFAHSRKELDEWNNGVRERTPGIYKLRNLSV